MGTDPGAFGQSVHDTLAARPGYAGQVPYTHSSTLRTVETVFGVPFLRDAANATDLRDLLLGTFDIHMGRAAQDANEVMKVLTLLSAVLLPSVVLAGVMGMNFQLPFFDDAGNFWIVVAAMVIFGVSMVIAARWRHWI